MYIFFWFIDIFDNINPFLQNLRRILNPRKKLVKYLGFIDIDFIKSETNKPFIPFI
jgi:hypothetical protein